MENQPRSSLNRSRIPVRRRLSFTNLPGPSHVNQRPNIESSISGCINLDNSSTPGNNVPLSSTNDRIESMFVEGPRANRDNLNNASENSVYQNLRMEEERIASPSTYNEPTSGNVDSVNLEDNNLVLSGETYEDDINNYSPIGVDNEQVSNVEWYSLQPEAILDDQGPSNPQPSKSSDNIVKSNYFPLSENLDGHWKRLREIYSHHIVEKFKELLAKEQLKICLEFNSRSFDYGIHVDKEAADEIKAIEVMKEDFEKLQAVLASLKEQNPRLTESEQVVLASLKNQTPRLTESVGRNSNMDHEFTLQFVF